MVITTCIGKRSFGSVLDVIPLANSVTKLTARCDLCGKHAFFTLRKTEETKTELIGGADVYMPVCRQHYVNGQVVIESARSVFTRHYNFCYSLIDIPIISIIRSTLIICVYGFCDGLSLSRGLYLGITTICSVCLLIFVSIKASFMFRVGGGRSEVR